MKAEDRISNQNQVSESVDTIKCKIVIDLPQYTCKNVIYGI